MDDPGTVIVECVTMVMTNIFGPNTKDAVLFHLKTMGISVEDAAKRPDDFMKALNTIFSVGSKLLEKRFVVEIEYALGIHSTAISRLRDVVTLGPSGQAQNRQKKTYEVEKPL